MVSWKIGPLVALAAGSLSLLLSSCGEPSGRQQWENTYDGGGEDLFLVDDDFACLGDARWEKVGNSRLWNPLGHQLVAAEHARSKALGEYPVGTVLQLFPGEASVKRGRGFSPETGDWEFLILAADADGQTVIQQRGTTELGNVGGSCIACHAGSAAFDYACLTNSGCGSLPFFVDTDVDPDTEDPRCR